MLRLCICYHESQKLLTFTRECLQSLHCWLSTFTMKIIKTARLDSHFWHLIGFAYLPLSRFNRTVHDLGGPPLVHTCAGLANMYYKNSDTLEIPDMSGECPARAQADNGSSHKQPNPGPPSSWRNSSTKMATTAFYWNPGNHGSLLGGKGNPQSL